MAKIRAYKLAAELGLEKNEFMDKLARLGINLRGPMSGLDEEQVAAVRARLGGKMTEERVEKRAAGGAVIRRRRRPVAPAPEPADAPLEQPSAEPAAAAAEAPADSLAPLAEEPPAVAAETKSAPGAGDAEPGVAAQLPARPSGARISSRPEPAPAGGRIQPPVPSQAPGRDAGAHTADVAGRGAAARRPVRRTHNEQVKLKEQEALGRTMLGNVQHRLEARRMIVEQQAREQRRRKTGPKKLVLKASGPKKKIIRVSGETSFKEIAAQTGVKMRDLVRRTRALGSEADRDDLLDFDTVSLLAADIGYEVQQLGRDIEEGIASAETRAEDLEPRPPVVTVMGHVDHGKTSLLDRIRQTNVVEGEAGGITQHIGAYKVAVPAGEIAFLDTPGHEAFTQMRARGAQATDVVVLVVAADDGIMPQTVEAIDHAKAAGVPIIVAINKIDRVESDPQRVKQALLEHELVPEEFGGDVICVELSALKGTNVDKLLEMLALQAEVLELSARRTGPARGLVIEAQLDKGHGPVATILVREGTMRRGDAFVAGTVSGRVRTLSDDGGKPLKEAGPSTPVQIVGLSGVPEAGHELTVVGSEREAKAIAEHRASQQRQTATSEASGPIVDEAVFSMLEESDLKVLPLVIKADVRGTMEAIRESAEKLSTERVKLHVIHAGVGAISERDVMLASASKAVVSGFHVRPEAAARRAAEQEGVLIRTFDVVYELLDDLAALMTGLLPPKQIETVSGHAEVRALFHVPRRGTIAGCFVPEGIIRRSDRMRVIRDGLPIYAGPIESLRHFKDDVREVRQGFECGIKVAMFDDYKVGDVLESFKVEEQPDTL